MDFFVSYIQKKKICCWRRFLLCSELYEVPYYQNVIAYLFLCQMLCILLSFHGIIGRSANYVMRWNCMATVKTSVVCQVKHTCIMTELSSQNVHICFFVFTPAHVEQQNIFVLWECDWRVTPRGFGGQTTFHRVLGLWRGCFVKDQYVYLMCSNDRHFLVQMQIHKIINKFGSLVFSVIHDNEHVDWGMQVVYR